MKYRFFILLSFAAVMALIWGCKSQPDKPKVEYEKDRFEVSLYGTRILGEDENYIKYGSIKPVTATVMLGRPFRLRKGSIVYFRGVLTRKDADNLYINGLYQRTNRAGRRVAFNVKDEVNLGILGGIYPIRRPDSAVIKLEQSEQDFLRISKIRKPAMKKDKPTISLGR